MFNKDIDELDETDIEQLIHNGTNESDTLEFKGDLSSKKGLDPWHNGKSVGDKARDELLEEIVAFANSIGGNLILGIRESDTAPPTATEINPIPRCADLALVLDQQAGACIEPQVPGLKFRGVPICDDGGGVVIATVPRSNMAPHRLRSSKECYTRRGERTEKMTMREIKDLALSTRDLSDYVEKSFEEVISKFDSYFDSQSGQFERLIGFQITAVPLDPDRISFDAYKDIQPPIRFIKATGTFDVNGGDTGNIDAMFPVGNLGWRPMMRGIYGYESGVVGDTHIEITNNGVVSIKVNVKNLLDYVYPTWLSSFILNAFMIVQRVKKINNAISVEYGLDCRVRISSSEKVYFGKWDGMNVSISRLENRVLPDLVVFPRYRLANDLDELLGLFVRDMFNLCGIDSGEYSNANWECKL